MADTTYTTNTTNTVNEEPATKHDVTEGGVIGAVGGAVVGALAGGPIGAVIGAVVGGAASAGAIGIVDKHDHDYTGTEYANSADTLNTDDEDLVTTNGTMAPSSYAADTSYAATTAAPITTDYAATTTTPTAAAYATTATMPATNYDSATAVRDTGDQVVVPIVEEQLQVGKRVEETGGAHIHTTVVETPVQQSVNLREEHVTVDRVPVDRAATAADFNTGAQDFTLTESREVPVVAKDARVVEEVVIGKTASEHTETINDTVRRTDVVVDDLGTTTKTGSTY